MRVFGSRRILRVLLFFATLLTAAVWLLYAVAIWGYGSVNWGDVQLIPKTGKLPLITHLPYDHPLAKVPILFHDPYGYSSAAMTNYIQLLPLPLWCFVLCVLLPDTLRTAFPRGKKLRVIYGIAAVPALLFGVLCTALANTTLLYDSYRTYAAWKWFANAHLTLVLIAAGLAVVFWLLPCNVLRFLQKKKERSVLRAVRTGFVLMLLSVLTAFFVTASSGLLLACLKPFSPGAVRYVERFCATDAVYPMALYTSILFAPVMEEIAFRGVIQHGLQKTAPTWLAVLLTALFFGFWHRNTGQFVYTTLVGLVIGFVYAGTGKLRYTILIHFCMNLLSAMCYCDRDNALLGRQSVLPAIRKFLIGLPLGAAIPMLILSVAILVLLVFLFRKTGRKKAADLLRKLFRRRGTERA